MEITKLPLTPLISVLAELCTNHIPFYFSIFFTLITQIQCLIPQFHKSLTNFNISYKIQRQTLTIHSLDFSNPNLIHFFLNFYQIHHDSTLNTPILPSIQENQSIRYEKHQNPTFPPLKDLLVLGFPWLLSLDSTCRSLEELEEGEKITSPLAPPSHVFSLLLSLLSFLSFLPSFSHMDELSSFEQTFIFLFLYFDPHNFSKLHLSPKNLIGW